MPDPDSLVDGFGPATDRYAIYERLIAVGPSALPAIRRGLSSTDWHVRHWSAICLDRMADADALSALVPLLEDPVPKVRLWAVHSLACDHCRDDVACDIDVVPLLIRRVDVDPSLKVRKMAVIMLSSGLSDHRAVPALERVLDRETDDSIRRHAREGLDRLRG